MSLVVCQLSSDFNIGYEIKRPFLANSIYLRLGEVQIATNENLWETVASSPFLGQHVRVASGRNVVNYHILWSRYITLF